MTNKKIILTLSILISSSLLNAKTSTQEKTNPNFLITSLLHTNKEIDECRENSGTFGRKFTITLVSMIPAIYTAYNSNTNWKNILELKNTRLTQIPKLINENNVLPALVYSASTFFASYFLLNKFYKAISAKKMKISNNQLLTSFVKKWEIYKPLTPVQFHEQFDELYNKYLNYNLDIDEYESTKIISNIVRESLTGLQVAANSAN